MKKIRKQQLRTGRMERTPQSHHGRVSRVTAEVQQQLRAAVGEQADITLWELQDASVTCILASPQHGSVCMLGLGRE